MTGNSLLNTHVLTIGTVKVTMDSVHNAIQKGAEQMVDNMIATVTGVPVAGQGSKKADKKPGSKADKKVEKK